LQELLRSGLVRSAEALARGAAAPPPALSTGVEALDQALGGGFFRGQISEIVALPSSGGTALLHAALGAATQRGELCALIDVHDAFNPAGALLDLRRLLWVRPGSLVLGLRAAELTLDARFSLVAIDLGAPGAAQRNRRSLSLREATPVQAAPGQLIVERLDRDASRNRRTFATIRPGSSPWARMQRRAGRQGVALLVLAAAPQAGPFAAATVEVARACTRWTGREGTPGRLLESSASLLSVVRSRQARPSGGIALSLQWG
jgi:hypothetical protein